RNNISYYYLNKYLDIGLQIYILGVGYTTVPFDHLPNDIGGTYRCHNGVSSQTTFYSGGSGFIYLYVKKQFTGTITIPSMVMANIYATIDPRTVSNEIISDVIVQGSVTVPQTCEIDEGQAIMIDFKSILASEFSANRGQAVSSRKITRQVNIKCSNMMFTDTLGATFHASAATADSTMVATDNPDVGIKIYDKHNREINVNGGELEAETTKMPVTLEGETLGTLTFSSAPASATGSRPAPGPFNGTATLTIEIGH
ncbi:fimbrial protein, partial [Enterobacter kobei]